MAKKRKKDNIDFSDRSDGDGYGVVRYDAEETIFEFEYDNFCEDLGRRYWPENVEVVAISTIIPNF